jgi:hypothetical protein
MYCFSSLALTVKDRSGVATHGQSDASLHRQQCLMIGCAIVPIDKQDL